MRFIMLTRIYHRAIVSPLPQQTRKSVFEKKKETGKPFCARTAVPGKLYQVSVR